MPYCLGMLRAPQDTSADRPEQQVKSWWAEYGAMIGVAVAVTVIICIAYVGARRGWLP